MALSSDALDVAILCSSKAKEFEAADSRFEVIPGIISNSSVIIVKDLSNYRIGVSSGREYEKDMVREMMGDEYKPFAMSTRALAYTMETGSVGGIVIDYISSINVEGTRLYPKLGQSFDTYSMIVSKDFIASGKFDSFANAYNEAVLELRQGDNLLEAAKAQLGGEYTDERRKSEWQMLSIKIQTLER